MGKLENAAAIVTGGAQGIGEAHVRALVAEGARVVVGDVDDRGRQVAEELGSAVRFVRMDVTSESDWASAVECAEQEFGHVSILVNNAGVAETAPLEETTLAQWRRILDVNLTGSFLGIKSVVPSMCKAKGGNIVNISSRAGLVGIEREGSYTASKWGVRGLTKVAALELGHYGIRVNSVHPGMTRTRLTAGTDEAALSAFPIPRFCRPEEIAQLTLAVVCHATYSTGSEFVADGGSLAGIMLGEH
jgi:3alpha(or 20beta)-hydroxysteroid dehydrogenase